MIQLIKDNRFEELKENLIISTAFKIHTFLLDVLNNVDVEIDAESFSADRYQEEFLEGLILFEALKDSAIHKTQFNSFTNILIELAFKMGGFIQVMSHTAMNQGAHLSDIEDIYKVNPVIRQRLQDFIEHLKSSENQNKSIANLSAAKALITNSIGNLLEKAEIGEDMLQFAESYEKVNQTEKAISIYNGIMNDFKAQSGTGLFPEIPYVDDRPKNEIKIFETARENFERLTGETIAESKTVHVTENENAKKLVVEIGNHITPSKEDHKGGFLDKLKLFFKK